MKKTIAKYIGLALIPLTLMSCDYSRLKDASTVPKPIEYIKNWHPAYYGTGANNTPDGFEKLDEMIKNQKKEDKSYMLI